MLYQNRSFRGLPASGPDSRAVREAIKDSRRVALDRAEQGTTAGRSRSTSFTVETHTTPIGFRVQCTVIHRETEAASRRETVVIWVRAVAARRLSLAELRRRYGLTAREGRVATLVEAGARTREIAHTLGIVHTARRHTEAVLRKLGVHSRMEVRGRMQSAE